MFFDYRNQLNEKDFHNLYFLDTLHTIPMAIFFEIHRERNHNIPVRVLLVERDNNDNTEMASWVKQLYEDILTTCEWNDVCIIKKTISHINIF